MVGFELVDISIFFGFNKKLRKGDFTAQPSRWTTSGGWLGQPCWHALLYLNLNTFLSSLDPLSMVFVVLKLLSLLPSGLEKLCVACVCEFCQESLCMTPGHTRHA